MESLTYDICKKNKIIKIMNEYVKYLDIIKKVIIDNQIEIIYYYSNENIDDNFYFLNNPIKKIIFYPSLLYSENVGQNSMNQNLNFLPEKLDVLFLEYKKGINYNKIENLPIGLKVLKLPRNYDYELNNLPYNLEVLWIFTNKNINNTFNFLPESLKELYITNNKNLPENTDNINDDNCPNLDNLPNGLEQLCLNCKINSQLNNLPRKLKILHLSLHYENKIYNLPDGLEELKIPLYYPYLSESISHNTKLKKIIIGFSNKSHFKNISSFNLETIPDYVEEIIFGDDFNQQLNYLPTNIKKITFGFNFRYDINYNLLDSIEYLEFGYNFNNIIYKYPSNLKVLKFGRNFSNNLNNLPEGLIELEINERFNSTIKNLPKTLKIFKFNEFAEYSDLDKLELSDSIEILEFGRYQIHKTINKLPKSLKYIKYCKSNKNITKLIEESNYNGKIEYYYYSN